MYNEDFLYHDGFKKANWMDVNVYNFSDQCPLLTKDIISYYFCTPRFFEGVELMDNVKEIVEKLREEKYELICPSMGWSANLKLKEAFLAYHFPYMKFIGINFNEYSNKAHIDMSDATLIDDEKRYLDSSSAKYKITFGDVFDWNKLSEHKRAFNWYEVYKMIERMDYLKC